MTIEDEYKILIGAYEGVKSMDNYIEKEYLLKDIAEYIKSFLKTNTLNNYEQIKEEYIKNSSLKTKLQDSLILLNKMNAKIDIILLIKEKIRLLK